MISERSYSVRYSATLALTIAALAWATTAADARILRHRHPANTGAERTIETSERYADFVVDAKTGRILHATNADAPRHPASLTKMMTLYIMFEELERKRFSMDSLLSVSRHASVQNPTKLGLRPGDKISVSDAIHGLVTQSANDAAVTIAENIADSEEAFARRMTQTAHRIGMKNTYFYNASGLPNAEQYTTARDMVTLGRALEERFPENYKVFATRSFAFRGRVYGNHNHLLGQIEGIDGIKTGYTEASGFNLVSSMHRDGRFIVAAVMGGSSGGARDAQMIHLLSTHLADASDGPQKASVFTDVRMAARDGEQKPAAPIVVASTSSDTPLLSDEHSRPNHTAPVTVTDKSPTENDQNASSTHPVSGATAAKPDPQVDEHAASVLMAKALLADKKHKRATKLDNFMPSTAVAKPAPVKTSPEAQIASDRSNDQPKAAEPSKTDADRSERLMTASIDPLPLEKRRELDPTKTHVSAMPQPVHEGWLIQIAAVDNAGDAKAILLRAKSAAGSNLQGESPVTETFAKGNTTLYRARFAGFKDQKAANAACNSLKHKEFACLVIHQ